MCESVSYGAMSTIVVKRPVATVVSPVPKAMGKNKNSAAAAAAAAAKEAKEAEKAAAKEAGAGGLSAYGCSMFLLLSSCCWLGKGGIVFTGWNLGSRLAE